MAGNAFGSSYSDRHHSFFDLDRTADIYSLSVSKIVYLASQFNKRITPKEKPHTGSRSKASAGVGERCAVEEKFTGFLVAIAVSPYMGILN